MALSQLTDGNAVLAAIVEYDRLGPEVFLAKYRLGPATKYHLVHEGKVYPSKAIARVAHEIQHGQAATFSGGSPVAKKLTDLGFTIEVPSTDQQTQ